MAHSLYSACTPMLKALWRLVRLLFRRSKVVVDDAEGGSIASNAIFINGVDEKGLVNKDDIVVDEDPVATFKPDLTCIPALTLSTMVVGAAITPKLSVRVPIIAVPGGPPVPRIVVTAPREEKEEAHAPLVATSTSNPVGESKARKSSGGRQPLRCIVNATARTHGRTAKPRVKEGKENIREHPNTPQTVKTSPRPILTSLLTAPKESKVSRMSKTIKRAEFVKALQQQKRQSIEPVKVIQTGSNPWDLSKSTHLAQARTFSEELKSRRRSLPTPAPSYSTSPVSLRRCSTSFPARLPLQERLRRAIVDTGIKPTVPVLWGDDNASFVLGEDDEEEEALDGSLATEVSLTSLSSGGSLTNILNAFEDDLNTSLWSDRRRYSAEDIAIAGARSSSNRDSTWSDVVPLDDYF